MSARHRSYALYATWADSIERQALVTVGVVTVNVNGVAWYAMAQVAHDSAVLMIALADMGSVCLIVVAAVLYLRRRLSM